MRERWSSLERDTQEKVWLGLMLAGACIVFAPIIWYLWQTYVPPPSSGGVVGRTFVPEHTVQDPPMCVSRDKNGTCTFSIPQSHVEPDAWYVTIHGCAVARDGKTRCREARVYVSEYVYHECGRPNAYYDRARGTCPAR